MKQRILALLLAAGLCLGIIGRLHSGGPGRG